ncbi:uncharacterized protein LOC117299498 [Asterias rubens]|uniref:uncharacterized protein LOC117299498 n=1 Tax=Asterias rubens TaxID=7604 RepID=UPI001455AA5C|nr:uncharacterized protein LOC117299498 [Asterias rubens]
MFPKHTVAGSVAIPDEKAHKGTTSLDQKHTMVIMVDNTQVAVENDRQWRVKRAAICACVFLLTVLILVAGALGAIAIVSAYNDTPMWTSESEPSDHKSVVGNLFPTHLPKPTKRTKLGDTGLWLTVTPDLSDVDDVTAVHESAQPTPSSDSFSYPDSSSSSDPSSSEGNDYYQGLRNWVSSSFPYGGYYMRGGVGDPPGEEESDTSLQSEASGDGSELSGEGALSDQEYGDESDVANNDWIPSSDDGVYKDHSSSYPGDMQSWSY